MKTESEHLDLEAAFAGLRRRWWVIAACVVVLGAASYALAAHQTKLYTASANVLFQDQQLSQQAAGLQVIQSSPTQDPRIMSTNIQLLNQAPGVAQSVAKTVGHGMTAAKVNQAVSVSQNGQTNIAQISVTDVHPRLAAAIANAYATTFVSSQARQQHNQVGQALSLVEHQLGALSGPQLAGTTGQALLDREESLKILSKLQNGGSQVTKLATVPTSPSSPKMLQDTVIGLLLGLVLGLGVAFVMERLDRRIKSADEVEAAYGVPLLAEIPRSKSFALAPDVAPESLGADAEVFKLLRAYLRYFNVDRDLRTLMIVSAGSGDGKTTVAGNLAEAAQETGTRTLLIEADLRLPTLAEHYGCDSAPGLSELLTHRTDPLKAIRSIPVKPTLNGSQAPVTLDVLFAGHPPPNPAELLESNTMADFLSWAAEQYEFVVIDTPPLIVVSDAIPLLNRVDGVVVVASPGRNTRDAAAVLKARLAATNAPVLGVVANGVKPTVEGGYSYQYAYSYAAAPERHALDDSDESSAESDALHVND